MDWGVDTWQHRTSATHFTFFIGVYEQNTGQQHRKRGFTSIQFRRCRIRKWISFGDCSQPQPARFGCLMLVFINLHPFVCNRNETPTCLNVKCILDVRESDQVHVISYNSWPEYVTQRGEGTLTFFLQHWIPDWRTTLLVFYHTTLSHLLCFDFAKHSSG